MRAEALPGDLGSFRVATFARSFHWMDRERVASIVRDMLEPGGSWVHFSATTHEGLEGMRVFPSLRRRAEIGQLIGDYLGPGRRAGSRTLAEGTQPPSGEDAVMVAAGFLRASTCDGCRTRPRPLGGRGGRLGLLALVRSAAPLRTATRRIR